jgi:V8-like Glu-specific endopeptidase
MRGTVTVRVSLAVLACVLPVPAAAQATGLKVVVLRGTGGATARRTRRSVSPLRATASSIRVADFSDEGLRTNGRIFGYDPREGAYSCSGTALSTPSRSIVLTAGHCVLEAGITGRKLVFIPAYDHGQRPFGAFVAEKAYLMPQWRHSENPDFDVAALQVAPSPLGRLTEVVGGRRFVTGRSRESSFQIFGYPAAALDGEELRSCEAHGLGSDELTNRLFGPPTMPATCDMAGGSSGGAWIVDGQYVDGVTSYGYTGSPDRLYSPYFGSSIGAFLSQLP